MLVKITFWLPSLPTLLCRLILLCMRSTSPNSNIDLDSPPLSLLKSLNSVTFLWEPLLLQLPSFSLFFRVFLPRASPPPRPSLQLTPWCPSQLTTWCSLLSLPSKRAAVCSRQQGAGLHTGDGKMGGRMATTVAGAPYCFPGLCCSLLLNSSNAPKCLFFGRASLSLVPSQRLLGPLKVSTLSYKVIWEAEDNREGHVHVANYRQKHQYKLTMGPLQVDRGTYTAGWQEGWLLLQALRRQKRGRAGTMTPIWKTKWWAQKWNILLSLSPLHPPPPWHGHPFSSTARWWA